MENELITKMDKYCMARAKKRWQAMIEKAWQFSDDLGIHHPNDYTRAMGVSIKNAMEVFEEHFVAVMYEQEQSKFMQDVEKLSYFFDNLKEQAE